MNTDFNNSFILVVVFYVFVSALSLYLVYLSYKAIIVKKDKTDKDIARRQRLISITTYLIATLSCILPFLYFNYSGMLSSQEEPDLANFLNAGMKYSFFLSMIILMTDSFIRRVISDIYVFYDVKYLNNFCLYLRSFNTDVFKQEKLICRTARNLFPVYAIGDPNHVLQPNGAERFYITDEHWKEAVINMMERSKVILLRVGQTDGTLWELHKLIELDYINKTIFVVYTKEDYEWFQKTIPESFSHLFLKLDGLETSPYAFFLADGLFYSRKVKQKKDFEIFLNLYLSLNFELDAYYTQELDLRANSLKYSFHSDKIPQLVRKSFNWQFVSPLIMMNHWPLSAWGLFILFVIISVFVSNSFNISFIWPMLPLLLFFILKGNSIEWASGGYSCPEFFIRIQRRKAMLMWYCYVLGLFLSIFYFYMYII